MAKPLKIVGDNGNNDLIAPDGRDWTLLGKGGDDTLTGNAGHDVLDGGKGTNTLDYSREGGTHGIRVNLDGITSHLGLPPDSAIDTYGPIGPNAPPTDSVPNNRNVIGTQFPDEIWGGNHPNRLEGRGGADYLNGDADNDRLIGGGGFDRVEGGTGNDRFVFDAPNGTSTDSVVDFSPGDVLAVIGTDYGLAAGSLDQSLFQTGSAPTTGHSEFFFDDTAQTQTLYWDADGQAGGSVPIATFETTVSLSYTDFLIL